MSIASWLGGGKAPAQHVKRDYGRPDDLQGALKRYSFLAEHDPKFGRDPIKEAIRARMQANGPVALSRIAFADGRLKVGQTAVNPARRVWRFRAKDPVTDKVVFERFVEGDDMEAAREAGVTAIKREWRALGLQGTESLMGVVLAV